jgi:hypothetical protein
MGTSARKDRTVLISFCNLYVLDRVLRPFCAQLFLHLELLLSYTEGRPRDSILISPDRLQTLWLR